MGKGDNWATRDIVRIKDGKTKWFWQADHTPANGSPMLDQRVG
jgi:hypothetical protein